MDTPSSMATFSASHKQTHDASNSNAKPDRSVLLDITNDSPIVGLAMGSLKTPSSSVAKKLGHPTRTPGSGEALLRGQVKSLLQKVEEETEIVKPSPLEDSQGGATFRALLGHLRSPGSLLAPTPANTPQIPGLHPGPAEGDLKIPQVEPIPIDPLNGEHPEECQLPRALLFDSPDKSDTSESSPLCSALTYEGSACSFPEKSTDEDCSSVWSTVANASSNNGDENGSDCYEDGEVEEEEEEEEEDEDIGDSLLDELCQGFSVMSVVERKGVPNFAGRHTRFVYNSDDEIEREEEVVRGGDAVAAASPGVLVLKGLPVPEGKHLRFQEEEED